MTVAARSESGARVALVLGDPAGVGAELVAKLLQRLPPEEIAAITVIGDARQLRAGASIAGVALAQVAIADRANADPGAIALGRASAEGGRAALDNFTAALDLARRGAVDAVCFTPFNKQALRLAGNRHEDELRYAAEVLGWRGPVGEFNILGRLWNARVTSHVPLSRVASLLGVDRILEAIALTDRAMRQAGFEHPRIAVAAFNPHAGDGGAFGREEIEVIAPAVAAAKQHGVEASGPYPADTVYVKARDGAFDAVVSMYHDQGQIAMKLLGFSRGVTLLGGLPVAVTTPAQGTAYDIAGRGVADPAALGQAFALARAMGLARGRRAAAGEL
jgi:4-hydroxythreonine-4-phosphate dehydrogenase